MRMRQGFDRLAKFTKAKTLADIEQELWDALNLTIFAAPLRPRAQRTKTHLSVPCMSAIQTRCSFLSREPSSPPLTIAPRRNMTGTHGRDRRRTPLIAGKTHRRPRM